MIHHSALSFKRLRSMKILDKQSVSMTVLPSDIDVSSDLGKTEFFGQFGTVQSLRVLQNSEPKEIYLRFDNESSAKQAIAWCLGQPSVFKNAQHGFNKYCITFINHKVCAKEKCENRHSWADTQDILTFAETRVPGVNVPPHVHTKTCSTCPSKSKAPAPAVAPVRAPAQQGAPVAAAPAAVSSKLETQQSAVQVALQSRLIDDLMRELAALQKVNYALKVDVDKLQRSQVAANAHVHAHARANQAAQANCAQGMNMGMGMGGWMSPMACHTRLGVGMNTKVNVPMNVPMRPLQARHTAPAAAYSQLSMY